MLAAALELEEIAVHTPSDLNWKGLPKRAILQLHWPREPAFLRLLAEHAFRVVVVARHPLDVLISILMFSRHEPNTARWLDSQDGNERSLEQASPIDAEFLGYATGPRARALLNVGAQWWSAPEAVRVRYEDLVDDPTAQLARLLAELGLQARRPLREAISPFSCDHMRSVSVDLQFHVWQARPGLWKRLLPAVQAQQIYQAQRAVFQSLGNACDPDESLEPVEAQRAWEHLELATIKRNLFGLKHKMNEAEARHVQRTAQMIAEAHRQRAELESLTRQLADLPLEQIRELSGLGPWSMGAARRLQHWSRRFPRFAGGVKSFVRFWRSILSGLSNRDRHANES